MYSILLPQLVKDREPHCHVDASAINTSRTCNRSLISWLLGAELLRSFSLVVGLGLIPGTVWHV